MNTILIVVMGVVLLSVLPLWPYSANWGYLPSGGLGWDRRQLKSRNGSECS
jgi:hypothetical protein